MTIKFWGANNPNGYLSNFYFSDFTLDGVTYPTVEHYFQSKKFEGSTEKILISNSNNRLEKVSHEAYIAGLSHPAETAKEGRRRDFQMRKDWEQVKEDVMYSGIKAKFTQSLELTSLLLNTKDEELVEDSPYDYYWGVGRSKTGQNRLGVLLMRLRNEITSIIDKMNEVDQ